MKKLLSVMLASLVVLSMSVTAFADAINYLFTANKTSLQPGDIVNLTLKLNSNPGVAYYKNVIKFDEDVFERIPITYEDDEEMITEPVKTKWGQPTINDDKAGETIMTWASANNVTRTTVLEMSYKVKADAVNGTDYKFTIECEQAKNASGAELVINSATTAAIEITGGAEAGGDEPEVPATEVNVTGDAATGLEVSGKDADAAIAGQKVLFDTAKATLAVGDVLKNTSRFIVKYVEDGVVLKEKNYNIYEAAKAEGDGEFTVAKTIAVGIAYDASQWIAENFQFSIVK